MENGEKELKHTHTYQKKSFKAQQGMDRSGAKENLGTFKLSEKKNE